jgi:hypothetical protein
VVPATFAAQGFVRWLSDASERLLTVLEEAFADEAEALISDKRHLLAAQVIHRGLEACSKSAVHLGEFHACFEQLDELPRIEGLKEQRRAVPKREDCWTR